MEDSPSTLITSQILALRDRGYSAKEIHLELKTLPMMGKLSRQRVNEVLRRESAKTADSRRIYEIHECVLEILGLVRSMASSRQKKEAEATARAIERRLIGSS